MASGEANYRSLAWIAASALFMQSLDATILNTALPTIAADLHHSPLEMQLAVISYALTVALFIPISGWVADKYGTLRVFRFAVGMFALGSLACAMSSSLIMLIFSRVLQGFGGALMMPVARLSIIRSVPKQELLPVWNLMATAGLTGPILGPILGGWIVTYTSWHWIFLINIPMSLLGIWLANRYMPNVTGSLQKLDWAGFFFLGGGLVGVTLGFDLISEEFIAKWQATVIVILGVILIITYCFHAQKRERLALLPLSLFKIRTFRVGIMANMLIRLCASGIPFLLPLMYQVVFHYSADKAGMLIAPIALSSMLVKPLCGRILTKLGYRTALISASIVLTLSIAVMSFLHIDSPVWILIVNVALYGGCISIVFTAVNTLTISELSDQDASAGSTFLSVVQQVGIGLGIAVSALILSLYRYFIGESAVQLQQAFGYTYLTSASFGVLLVLVLSGLKKEDGAHLHK
ncbi:MULTISPECIES: DHA2 family efflux MFS transporter permease subunit [Basfia]|uniref:ProP protein n=2 Tax=Basfia TaxID=697331 RepID=Q65QU9_MANSM|nr:MULTISPECIES: DHA2 family efflux MFS transporter permease subunit [Basfia]AAU38661.1 ProP protein [[Mannheimia] succiniciproducens MBEL55E]QIM69233.1 MFS transporter [Basfia succiniciproducens]SCY07659.1 drug resistance transporter, EmrB/QacA subfamily [Basfia succiniciproducens]SEP56210.1 drug resistance transporter, EmrB/QacA subfamily [Basfia succiniciproducens]